MREDTVRVKELRVEEKPREKFASLGAKNVTEAELIAILLRTGMKGHSVLEVAREVLRRLKSRGVYGLGDMSYEELMEIPGIGQDKAITLCAAVELGRRIVKSRIKEEQLDFSKPEAIASYVMEEYRHYREERFGVAFLSTKNTLMGVYEVSRGALDRTLVDPRVLFTQALLHKAARLVLIHNHPSGDPQPSKEDILLTKRVYQGGQILGIEVLDHIIIGDGTYCSLFEEGYL